MSTTRNGTGWSVAIALGGMLVGGLGGGGISAWVQASELRAMESRIQANGDRIQSIVDSIADADRENRDKHAAFETRLLILEREVFPERTKKGP